MTTTATQGAQCASLIIAVNQKSLTAHRGLYKGDDMNEDRKDYIRRLIVGVREQIAKDPETIEINEQVTEYGDLTPAKWVDADLLCSVIEKEVLDSNLGG